MKKELFVFTTILIAGVLLSQSNSQEIVDLLKRQDWAAAEVALDRALAEAPEKEWLYTNQAWVCQNLKKFDKGIRIGQQGLDKWPDSEKSKQAVARIRAAYSVELRQRGDEKAALRQAEQAYATYPRDYYYFVLAQAHRELGDFEKAVAILMDGRQKYPAYEKFKTSLPYTRHLYFNSIADKASQAELKQWVETVLSAFEDPTPEYHYTRIVNKALRKIGDQAYFEATYKRMVARFPREPQVYDDYGFGLFVNERLLGPIDKATKDRAIALRRQALQMYTARHGARAPQRDVPFPLRGRFEIWAEFGGTAMTHNGFGHYCYDFAAVNEAGEYKRPGSSGKSNSHYYNFGQKIYAIADGKVAGMLDSLPDNAPGDYTAEANYLTVDHGDYEAFYAHLKRGSARVREGQQVRAGQVLGEVGNSGMSSESHLHFCLRDPNQVASIPYHFRPARVWTKGASRVTTDFYKFREIVEFE